MNSWKSFDVDIIIWSDYCSISNYRYPSEIAQFWNDWKRRVVEVFREMLNVQQSGFKWYYLAELNLSLALKQFKRTCRRFLSKNFEENQVNHTSSFHLSPQKQRNLCTHTSCSWLRSFVRYESIFPPQKCVACKRYRIIISSWDLHTLWNCLCRCTRAYMFRAFINKNRNVN